ncbi:MAG: hypothetical protein ACYDCL_15190 [Myxococcales bacterium]
MASPLLQLAVLEALAREAGSLPPVLARALAEDVEYGRFGVLLPDLPSFEQPVSGLRELAGLRPRPPPLFARLLHGPRPMALLFKAAELVGRGALVGRSAGQALLAGYLVHVALDRALDPQAQRLAEQLGAARGAPAAVRRVEWLQALCFLQRQFGRDPLGSPELVDWMRVTKRRGVPWAGVGGGIYEITRLSLLEVYGQAPPKRAVDSWVRGLYLQSRLLASPLGTKLGGPALLEKHRPLVFLGPGVDFPTAVSRGVELARRYLARLDQLLGRGDFGPRARGRFLSEVPEGDAASAA